ncbi:unnamed protein product [Bursaphelenchus xylophilus]|uniref:(pine wood nematode) hypothetical protein n=1 Tax=Bursaphelenchus xylophilus TaxID=6326 RepID=A0A1I7RUD3_BURXY|nr:unnamed protein product [Bursaphelenchus xylophilus]CAG9114044.1 unnamed protein product [Bursaphelenchus xylophilus]
MLAGGTFIFLLMCVSGVLGGNTSDWSREFELPYSRTFERPFEKGSSLIIYASSGVGAKLDLDLKLSTLTLLQIRFNQTHVVLRDDINGECKNEQYICEGAEAAECIRPNAVIEIIVDTLDDGVHVFINGKRRNKKPWLTYALWKFNQLYRNRMRNAWADEALYQAVVICKTFIAVEKTYTKHF